jgi:hypothetical protein
MFLSGWGMNLICYQLSYVNRYEYTLVHGYKQVMILDVPTKSTNFSCTIGKPSCSPCSVESFSEILRTKRFGDLLHIGFPSPDCVLLANFKTAEMDRSPSTPQKIGG